MKLFKVFIGLFLFAFFFFFSYPQLALAVSPGDVVINEIYYDVDSAHGSETSNEWIELYNKSATTVDISGWTITDNNSTRVVPDATTPIPAGGILLISPDSSTWNYWTIDASAIKLLMSLGNGLSNTGDKLLLKDGLGNEIDAISYGANIDVWNPSIEDVAEGHSLERIPGGTDSNSLSDFVDQESPTPGRLIAQAPTSTPTPTPTSTPSPTPTSSPTNTPTPTLKPTPTPTPTPTKTPTPTLAFPTEILGGGTESASIAEITSEIQPEKSLRKKTEVLGEKTSIFPKILIGLGSILLIAGGLLAFKAYIKYKKENLLSE